MTQPVRDPAREAERHVLARVSAGDRHALGELYARFHRPLLQYLLQLTPDRGVAEEILQDTFLAVWHSAQTFEGRASLQSWLFGVARRQAHNTLRRAQLPVADAAELEYLTADDAEPEAAAFAGLEREALVAAVQQLPVIHREVLVLIFMHGLSYQDVADVIGVPVGTVKSRLSHAKQGLRRLLQPAREVEEAFR